MAARFQAVSAPRCVHLASPREYVHALDYLGVVWLMSSIESGVQTNTPEPGRYLSVDPQTLGRLRILRVGDV
jgi:hypothetical protein